MAIIGQLIFVFIADAMNPGDCTLNAYFVLAYIVVSVLQASVDGPCCWPVNHNARIDGKRSFISKCRSFQVMLLLYIAHIIIHAMWRFKIDPDNSAIPYLTALGDLTGSLFLASAFAFIYAVEWPYCQPDLEP